MAAEASQILSIAKAKAKAKAKVEAEKELNEAGESRPEWITQAELYGIQS